VPPATKTLPSVNNVAVGDERALTIIPALAHPPDAPAAGAQTPDTTTTAARLDLHTMLNKPSADARARAPDHTSVQTASNAISRSRADG
jgi:hypothetical protein